MMTNCGSLSPPPPPLNDVNVHKYIGKTRHTHSRSTRRRKQKMKKLDDMDLIIRKLPPFLVGDDGTTTATIVLGIDLQKDNFRPSSFLREACFLVIQFKCHSNSNPVRGVQKSFQRRQSLVFGVSIMHVGCQQYFEG